MDNVLRTINTSLPKPDEEAFALLKDDDLRVAFMLKRDLIHDSLVFHASHERKSPTKSKSSREEGNKLFKKKEYRDSVQSYTNSILLAPTEQTYPTSLCTEGEDPELSPNEQLPLAFANRSAAFLHLRKFQLCIQDVENAMQHGYPKNMLYKLYDRKGKCYMGLKQYKAAEEEFNKALECIHEAKLDEKALNTWTVNLKKELKSCEKGIDAPLTGSKQYEPPQIKERNAKYPLLNASVDVHYDDKIGRHLKATSPISVGGLILAEKPFASILLPDYYENHCYHCLRRLQAGVPDHQCGNLQYCNDTCRKTAWEEYHKGEYPFLNLFTKEWCGTLGHLVYRVVTKVGFAKLMEFLEEHKQLLQEDKKGEVLNKDGVYDDGFYSIYHMETNIKQRVPEGLSDFTVFAVYLSKVLQISGFYQDSKEPIDAQTKYNSTLVKITGTIMRLLQIIQINSRGIIELMYPTDFEDPKPTDIGMAIYPTAALINHSCNPSAVTVYHGNQIEVHAISNIGKGKEVNIDYGMVFYKNVLAQRRMNLSLKYSFQCKCEACVKNWPLWRDLLTDYPLWKCEDCGYELNVIRTIGGNMIRCDRCNHMQDLEERIKKLGTSHDLFNKSMEEALEGKIDFALPGFQSHLSLCQKYLLPPWRDLVVSQAAVRQSLRLKGNVRLI